MKVRRGIKGERLLIPLAFWKKAIQMGERMGRIGRMSTDFLFHAQILGKKSKKIRTHPPDPPHPFSHLRLFVSPKSKIYGRNTKNTVQTFSNESYETIFVITYLQKLRAS